MGAWNDAGPRRRIDDAIFESRADLVLHGHLGKQQGIGAVAVVEDHLGATSLPHKLRRLHFTAAGGLLKRGFEDSVGLGIDVEVGEHAGAVVLRWRQHETTMLLAVRTSSSARLCAVLDQSIEQIRLNGEVLRARNAEYDVAEPAAPLTADELRQLGASDAVLSVEERDGDDQCDVCYSDARPLYELELDEAAPITEVIGLGDTIVTLCADCSRDVIASTGSD